MLCVTSCSLARASRGRGDVRRGGFEFQVVQLPRSTAFSSVESDGDGPKKALTHDPPLTALLPAGEEAC